MRFAILHHTGVPAPHFDLLVETAPDAPLLTFRLEHWPSPKSADVIRQPDHRRIYLDYEGPISNNRGQVRRIAAGECTIHDQTQARMTLTLSLNPPLRLHLAHVEADRWQLTIG